MSSHLFPSLKPVVRIIAPTSIVLLAHIFRVFVFPLAYEWDQLMHFMGGASIAWIAWSSMGTLQKMNRLPLLPLWFRSIVSISFAGLVGLVWELYEYATFIWWIPSMNILLADTEHDMLLDVSGAILLILGLVLREWFLQKRKQQRSSYSV